MLNAFFGELQNSLGGPGAGLADAVLNGAKGVAIALIAIVMARWLGERVHSAAHAAGFGANAPTLLGNLSSIAVYVATGGIRPGWRVTRIGRAPAGVSLAIELAHESDIDPGHRIAEQVHARFPEATVVVERATA